MSVKLTKQGLDKAFPKLSDATVEMLLKSLPKPMEKFELNTVNRLAAFLAQTAHESAMFSAHLENLNYSADGLRKIFGKYFPTQALAESYARKPEKIANRVYANRMGNGDEKSGDGFKFRGRGWLQITGHDNVAAFAKFMGMTINEAVAYLETTEGGFMGAGWFWSKNGLNAFADKGDIVTISKRINGGTIGLEDRKALYSAAQRALTFA
jgi:putative chitinase